MVFRVKKVNRKKLTRGVFSRREMDIEALIWGQGGGVAKEVFPSEWPIEGVLKGLVGEGERDL